MFERILDYYPFLRYYLLPYLWCYLPYQTPHQLLNIFNIYNYHTTTLPHIFMSEIPLHTAQLLETYLPKNSDFLGDTGVDNIIYVIYNIIYYAIYTIRHIFLCDSVIM